jgi:hypothetical protein
LLGERPAADAPPSISGQVTFLYFNDLDRAAAFYGKTLALRKTFDGGWVKIFALSPTSSVGLVDSSWALLTTNPRFAMRASTTPSIGAGTVTFESICSASFSAAI